MKTDWIVLGTGPSFFDPHKKRRFKGFGVVTLNRAIAGVERTDAAFVAHRLTLEAIRFHLCKADTLYLADPFDADGKRVSLKYQWKLLVWAPRPHNRRVVGLPWRVGVPRLDELLTGPEGFNLCHEMTVAALAFSWLRQHGVETIHTAGMDVTGAIHKTFVPYYSNLPDGYGWNPDIPDFMDDLCWRYGIQRVRL